MTSLTSRDAMFELLEHLDSLNVSEGVSLEIKNGMKKVFEGLLPELPGLQNLPPTTPPVRTIQTDVKLKIYTGSQESIGTQTIEIKKYLVYPGSILNRYILSVNGVERNIESPQLKKLLITTMTLNCCAGVKIDANGVESEISMSKGLYLKKQEDEAQHYLRYEDDEDPEDFDCCPCDYDIECYYKYIYDTIQNLLNLEL